MKPKLFRTSLAILFLIHTGKPGYNMRILKAYCSYSKQTFSVHLLTTKIKQMKKLITLFCILCYATITVHAQKNGDYRSVKSGNWTDFANVWQKYNGTKWVAATNYPTSSNGVITIQDTTNVTINLNLTIDQTVVAPGGQLSLVSNYTVTLAGSGDALTVNGLFSWSSGTLASTGAVKIFGSLLWAGGSLQSSLTNKGTIAVTGNISLYSALTNAGTINWYSDYITFENGSLTNNSIFNVYSNGYLYNGNGGTFTNSSTGIYNQANGNTVSLSAITFNNKGVMNLNSGIFRVNAGTFTNTKKINFNGGNFENNATTNLNSGTVIAGTGNLTEVYNSLNVNLALSLPASITMHITGGTVAGSGSLKIPGTMDWEAGAVNVALNIQSTGILNISNGNVSLYSTITNNGVINWSSAYLSFFAGTIVNNKKFNAYGNGILYNSSGGTFTNSAGATFTRLVGTGNVTNQITFTNAGTVNISSGEIYNNGGTFSNTGVLNLSGGNFESASTANFNAGTSVTGKGSLLASYNSMNMNTAVTLPANVALYITSSATVAGTGSLKISGKMYWYSGNVNVPLTILNGATVYIGSSNVGLYSTLTNNGVINWASGYIYFYGGSIVNNKTFNIQCDAYLYKQSSGTFTNSKTGTVIKSSLGITNVTILFTNEGIIEGAGSFAFGANLTNTGTFAPGVDDATGILTTGTNYTNKKLSIKMNSATPGLGFDRLLVNGNVTFGNDTLEVIASDTMPAGSYTVMKWTGLRSGTIKIKDLPAGYTVSYPANKVVVTVPSNFANANNVDVEAEDTMSSTISKVFSVFPNPASKMINVSYQIKNKSAMLQIFNIDGKAVAQTVITGGSNSKIDISNLSAGTYILQLKDGEITRSAKFIKQ